MTRELEAAKSFYTDLFGWRYLPGLRAGSVIAAVNGIRVASLVREPGFTPVWTPYFGSTDVDATAEAIRERGGTVAVGPLRMADAGRVAWVADPFGAAFGIWAGEGRGWELDRGPGTPTRLELSTRDAFDATLFYDSVFVWDRSEPRRFETRYENDRVFLVIDGHRIAGIFGGAVEAAPDPKVRPHWQVYFSVRDVQQVADRAEELGGAVEEPPHDSPYGPEAALRDPEGARFRITASG